MPETRNCKPLDTSVLGSLPVQVARHVRVEPRLEPGSGCIMLSGESVENLVCSPGLIYHT